MKMNCSLYSKLASSLHTCRSAEVQAATHSTLQLQALHQVKRLEKIRLKACSIQDNQMLEIDNLQAFLNVFKNTPEASFLPIVISYKQKQIQQFRHER
jgi:hypothetical protein